MCSLKQPVTSTDPNATYTGAGAPPSESPITGVDSSLDKPPAAPTSTTMMPTKFGKLLKVVLPLVQGAGVGGFGGNWKIPGSGFAAEQGMRYRQQQQQMMQQEMQLRQQMLARQMYDDQYRNALEAARSKQAEATAERQTQLAEEGVRQQGKVKPVIEDTDAGIMSIDPESAQARPVTNMEPEKTGSLPLPNEPEVAPLHKATKPSAPERPLVLGQGQEAIEPGTGKVIAKGEPKTFAPKSPRSTQAKPDAGKIETYAGALVKQFGGDAQKALDAVEGLKSLDPAAKSALRQRIREMQRPASTRKLPGLSTDQMKRLAQQPAG